MSGVHGWFTQNIALPFALLPTRSRSTRYAREIRSRQHWPQQKMRDWQLDRVTKLIRLAESESPFYRERFKQYGVSSRSLKSLHDLDRFPVTTKQDIESNFPDGMIIQSRRAPDWQYIGTRGTTRRVVVVQDFERRDIGRASEWVAMTEDSPYSLGNRQLSIPPDACSSHCGTESKRAETVAGHMRDLATGERKWDREWKSDLRGLVMGNWFNRIRVLPPLATDADDATLQETIAEIRRYRPMQLIGLPEYLKALASYLSRTGDVLPKIPVLRPMGANFPASWKRSIEEAFGGVVREHYGSREMGPMAFDCSERQGMHLFSDVHRIEVVKNGKPASDGEVGQVLVTDLHNHAMPIIRYQIGDLATIDHVPCKCGRQTPRISMQGRIDDAFVLPSGRILTAESISNFVATLESVDDYQLEEKTSGQWLLRVVPKNGVQLNEEDLATRLQKFTGDPRRVWTKIVKMVRPESSGKFRHTKSISFSSFESNDNA